MRYLLDSNAIIQLVRGLDAALVARAGRCNQGELVTSAIAYAEVAYGSLRGRAPAFDQLRVFLEEVDVLDFGVAQAMTYASLPFKRASYDRLIAAHALSLGLIVVTNNVADFAIPGLVVENWMMSA